VSERLIDRFEVVEVKEQDGQRRSKVAPAAQRMLEPIAEQRTVREPRDRIVEGLVRQLAFELLALSHVAEVDDGAGDGGIVEHAGHAAFRFEQVPVAVPDSNLNLLRGIGRA
jgi:hypothetical protein